MRAAPLLLVGLALSVVGAGFWLLGSGPPEAAPQEPAALASPTDPSGNSEATQQTEGLDTGPRSAPDMDRGARIPTFEPAPAQASTTSKDVLSEAEEAAPAALPETKRLVGWVSLSGSATGLMLSGVEVSAFGDHAPLAATVTHNDGSFAIDIPGDAEQPLMLLLDSPRTYPKEFYLGRPTLQRTDLGLILLAGAEPLAGTLTTSKGLPPTAAWARALPEESYSPATEADIDASGRFQFPKVDERGLIFLGAQGQQVSQVLAAQLRSAATSDPEGLARVQLMAGHSLAVRVVDSEKQPIPSARVQLLPSYPFSDWDREAIGFKNAELYPTVLNAQSNALGEAHFGELDDERYFARVEAEGFLRGFDIVVAPGEDTEIEFVLESAPLAKFRVLGFDPDRGHGVPIKGVRAGLLSAQDRRWGELPVNGKGDTRHYMDNQNAWTIEAWAPGFRLQTERMIPALTPDAPPQIVLLFPVETDLVHIVDERGQPLEGATLTGDIMSKARRKARITRDKLWTLEPKRIAEGVFAVPRVDEDGAPRYSASAPNFGQAGWSYDHWPKAAADAAPNSRDLFVTLQPQCSLEVYVEDADGVPSVGAKVYITRDGKGSPKPWVTDAFGKVQITGLGPGEITLQVRGPTGEISEKIDYDVKPNTRALVSLNL